MAQRRSNPRVNHRVMPAVFDLDVEGIEGWDIITVALAPGRWMFHCHIFSHMHAAGPRAGHQMAGLVTTLDVEPAAAPAVPPLNGVNPATGVPAAPVTPWPDNPPGGDNNNDKDKKGGGGSAPSGPLGPPVQPPHHRPEGGASSPSRSG